MQVGWGDQQGLQGPPPHPAHPWTLAAETPVPERPRPTPSALAPRNLMNCRREAPLASVAETLCDIDGISHPLSFRQDRSGVAVQPLPRSNVPSWFNSDSSCIQLLATPLIRTRPW